MGLDDFKNHHWIFAFICGNIPVHLGENQLTFFFKHRIYVWSIYHHDFGETWRLIHKGKWRAVNYSHPMDPLGLPKR